MALDRDLSYTKNLSLLPHSASPQEKRHRRTQITCPLNSKKLSLLPGIFNSLKSGIIDFNTDPKLVLLNKRLNPLAGFTFCQ